MSNTSFLKRAFALTSAGIVLAACGNGDTDSADESGNGETTELTIGASNTPHAEILEFIEPRLEEEGIELDIVTFDDYVLPNVALEEGDLDANYFQHVPYLEGQIEEHGYDFVNAGGVHIEPIAAYSQRHESLEDLPEGADVLISSNVADYGRILEILVDADLVEVDPDVELTEADFDDIEENPLDLNFEFDFDPSLMPTLYNNDEGDVVFINSNFAVDHGLNPLEDSIAIQDVSEDSPYANLIVVREEDEGSEAIQTVLDVLHEEETQDFILETWDGAVVPVGGE